MRSVTTKRAAALTVLIALVVGVVMLPHDTAVADPATRPATKPAGELQPYTETIPASLVTFDLVPVPAGDGVAAFYFGKHEVTWDEFYFWAIIRDIDPEAEKVNLRSKKLRPSPPYVAVDHGFGMKNMPALGMSRRSAELYCEWLSEQTGKTYRLPTRAEWQHAFKLAYGPLDTKLSKETLDAVAWYAKNSDEHPHEPGGKQPTPQGNSDLLGNVAEWVTDTENPAVVGGGFRSYARDLRGDAAEDENQDVWNQGDPSQPKSQWWYIDADYVGFRVVCEP